MANVPEFENSGFYEGEEKLRSGIFLQETLRLRRFLHEKGIASVLLGLSGGPDSVLTLHLLMKASETLPGFRLGIAHANFHLRGEESLRDEAFVRALIDCYPEIEAHFISFDTAAYCREKGCSVETGARTLRHEWFDRLCAAHGYDRIATGHNAGDNEETLLLNMLRGSGTRGLRGMEEDNGRVIRPLLRLSRREVMEILSALPPAQNGLPPFVIDSTNETDEYRRNFLRHKVLPLLDSRWEGARRGIQTTLRLIVEENRIVEHAVASALAGTGDTLPWEVISSFPSPLTLIYRWIAPHGGSPERAAEMVATISSDRRPRTGARWQLRDVEITATAAGLRLSSLSANNLPGTSGIPPSFKVTTFDLNELAPEQRDKIMTDVRKPSLTTVWLPGKPKDYAWRHPLKGERMKTGAKGSKLISDILRENGVTASLRPEIWLLEYRDTGRAVWIPGIRRGYDNRISGRENEICSFTVKTIEAV